MDNISQFSDEDLKHLLNQLDDKQFVYMVPAIVMSIVIAIVGSVGNLLILYIYPHHIKRSSTYYLVIAMACYDLAVCVLVVPLDIHVNLKTYNNRNEGLCKTYRLLTNTLLEGSCFIMAFVGVDRYIKVFRPFYRIAGSLIKWVCFLLGLVAFFLNLPFAILLFGICRMETNIPGLEGYRCLYKEGTKDSAIEIIFGLSLALIFVSLSVLLAYCYGSIFWYVRKRKRMTIGATMSLDMRNRLGIMANTFREENTPTPFYSLPSGSAVDKASLPLEKKCAPTPKEQTRSQSTRKNFEERVSTLKANVSKTFHKFTTIEINAVTSLDSVSSIFSKPGDIAVYSSATSPKSHEQKWSGSSAVSSRYPSTMTTTNAARLGQGISEVAMENVVNAGEVGKRYDTARNTFANMYSNSVVVDVCDTSLSKPIPLLQPADNVAAKHQALDNRVQMEVDDQPASSVLPGVGHTADIDCKKKPPLSSEAVGVGSKKTFMSDKAFLKTKLPVPAEVPSTSSKKPEKSILYLKKSKASEVDMETIRATKLSEKGVGKVEKMSGETSKDVPISGETSASHKGCENTGKTETSRDEPPVFGEGEGAPRQTQSCHKHVTIALETEESHTDATIPRETEASQEDVVTPGETEASNKLSKTPGETEPWFLRPEERARMSSMSPKAAGQTPSGVNAQWNPISQTTVSLFIITLIFFICNIASIILVFMQPSRDEEGSSWVNLSWEFRLGIRAALFKLAYVRHAINPLIYFFRQPNFRKHTKKVLRSVFCRCQE